MSLIKLNNNAVKNIDSLASVGTGDLVFISKQTASSSASIEFTSGIDSTYKEYVFYFVNMHPSTDNVKFQFQASTDSGSTYATTMTTTVFDAYHNESGTDTNLGYRTNQDQAQGTSFQSVFEDLGADNDQSGCAILRLFNPSSNTFVKHFLSTSQRCNANEYSVNNYVAGYFNTTSPINAIQFRFSSGNIDSGDILLYGVN